MTLFYLISFGVSLLFSFVLTWCVRNLAMGRGWVAPPIQDRDLHETALPRLGGVPIFLSFMVTVGLVLFASLHFPALAAGLSAGVLRNRGEASRSVCAGGNRRDTAFEAGLS